VGKPVKGKTCKCLTWSLTSKGNGVKSWGEIGGTRPKTKDGATKEKGEYESSFNLILGTLGEKLRKPGRQGINQGGKHHYNVKSRTGEDKAINGVVATGGGSAGQVKSCRVGGQFHKARGTGGHQPEWG